MGCSSANILEEKLSQINPSSETASYLTVKSNKSKNKKKDVYKIKRKGHPTDDNSFIELPEKEQLEQIAKEEIEILNQI